jgi:hypothetical protein
MKLESKKYAVLAILAALLIFPLPLYGQSINQTLELVKQKVVDINHDGKITCIDYSVCLYRRHPDWYELVWDTTHNHLAVLLHHPTRGLVLIEPQSSDLNYTRFWGFTPYYVYIVTDYWDERNKVLHGLPTDCSGLRKIRIRHEE